MFEVLRTLLLAGVGVVDMTDEKIRPVIEDLIRRGELATDEAKELATLWATGARERRDAIEARVKTAVEEALARHNVASHASVVALQSRVELLEQQAARTGGPLTEP